MNQTFHGVIAREVADSTPWWPEPNVPPASAPNVLVALLDDTGFAHLGCFGSAIDTPNFDRLAAAACDTATSTRPLSVRPLGRAC